jgi:hypothetical protein
MLTDDSGPALPLEKWLATRLPGRLRGLQPLLLQRLPLGDKAAQRAAHKQMARLERQLGRLQEVEAALHAELAAKATDHEAVLTLDAKLRGVVAERETLEEQWLEAAEVAG